MVILGYKVTKNSWYFQEKYHFIVVQGILCARRDTFFASKRWHFTGYRDALNVVKPLSKQGV